MLISLQHSICRFPNALAVAVLLSIGSTALADLERSEEQQAALVDLYHATDGDNWERNDHWLDEDVSVCDWYGVECSEVGGQSLIHLALSSNNLSGSLPASLGDMPGLASLIVPNNELTGDLAMSSDQYRELGMVDIRNNQIEALEIAPDAAPKLGIIVASNNLLAGSFPTFLQGREQFGAVDLSHNLLSGDLPEWLADLNLNRLLLGGNDFTGSIAPALAALADDLEHNPSGHPDSQLRLDLRSNRFSGELDDWLTDYAMEIPNWINLCWNELTITSPAAESMLADEHMDGEFEYCLGRSFQGPQIAHSGSWFDPERSGEGISMMLLDNGQTLIHWFTYAPPEHLTDGQAWFSGNREQVLPGFDMIDLYAPIGGEFAQGLPNPDEYQIGMGARVDVLDIEEAGLHTRQYVNILDGDPDFTSQILEYVQLTQLAGTTCDNQSEFQQFSGAWYHPNRTGEGFVIEVLPDDRALVYWFTYAADGSGDQAWVMGDGEFLSSGVIVGPVPGAPVATIHIEDVYLPTGALFGDHFDPEAVELLPWGRFELEFISEDEASIYWESDMEGFNGAGDYALQRLATPLLAECD
jgi:hypothetical protein